MLRLFTGIALPILLRQRLSLLGGGGIGGAKWVERENFHLTLSFIGEVDEAAAEDLDMTFEQFRVKKFSLRLKGTGSFAEGSHLKSLWVGVEPCDALNVLKEKIDRVLQTHRIPIEKRNYLPHVTLARLKNSSEEKVAAFMQQHNLFSSESFEVSEFTLFESHLTKHGAAYEALREYPLV